MKGFMDFIREQGVVGLAVGFMLGGAVSKVVSSLVTEIINPMLGLVLGFAGDFKSSYLMVGTAKVAWGNFLAAVVDFLIIALVVYYVVKGLGLDKLDKKTN
jgi:large conductance mechanosensitive channel